MAGDFYFALWYNCCMNKPEGITYIAQDGSFGDANGIIIIKNSDLAEGVLETLTTAPDKRKWAFEQLSNIDYQNTVVEHSGTFLTTTQRTSLNNQVREFYLGKNYTLNQ